jgi:hypothetical protein
MLRLLVTALVLANLVFWAWHQPKVAQALGLPGAEAGREPGRLARQIRPDSIRILPAGPAGSEAAAPPLSGASPSALPPDTALLCLEAGPLNDSAASAATLELAQAGVAGGGWVDMQREVPGRWIVYMGRFAERDALQRKVDELQRLKLPFSELRTPAELTPGLALGEFGTQADAQAMLDQLQNRGVRTAKIQQLPSPGVEHRLRVDRLDPAAGQRLATQGTTTRWQPCVRG